MNAWILKTITERAFLPKEKKPSLNHYTVIFEN